LIAVFCQEKKIQYYDSCKGNGKWTTCEVVLKGWKKWAYFRAFLMPKRAPNCWHLHGFEPWSWGGKKASKTCLEASNGPTPHIRHSHRVYPDHGMLKLFNLSHLIGL
jgi:hypothetical protein